MIAWAGAVLAALLAIVCHEGAHIAMAMYVGVKVKKIGMRFGVSSYIVREPGHELQNLAISMAGPLVSLALGSSVMLSPWLGMQVLAFGIANYGIGIVNLIPIPPADGGRILGLLRNCRRYETTGRGL